MEKPIEASGPRLRILFLEDTEADAFLILRHLRKADIAFDAVRAATRDEYLAALRAAPLDLILSDYALPGFDGMSALALAQGVCPDVPFIFVTGALGEERAIDTLKAGATDYVLKDRLARLAPAVLRALEEAAERSKRRLAEEQVRGRTAELETANRELELRSVELETANQELELRSVELETANQELELRSVELEEANQELARRGEQLQTLSRRLVEVQEAERAALGRDLHDTAAQALTALGMRLSRLDRLCDEPTRVRNEIADLRNLTDQIMLDLRRLAVNLRPASLDRFGLVAAVEQYIESLSRQTDLRVDLRAAGLEEARLPPEVETALYRIIQEALANVVRHSRATTAAITLARANGALTATITDNGIGMDPDQARRKGRLGLLGMTERAQMLGGQLDLDAAPGRGTTIRVRVPLIP